MFFWKKKLDQNNTIPAQPTPEAVLESSAPSTPSDTAGLSATSAVIQSVPTTSLTMTANTKTESTPLSKVYKKIFTKNNILYFLCTILVLGYVYLGINVWQNRTGTVTLSGASATNMNISVNKEFYTEFPVTIRLKPGTYSVISTASSRLPNTSNITIKAFSNIKFDPELKATTAIGFINQDGYVGAAISTDEKILRYFDKNSKTFAEVALKPAVPEIADNTKYISDLIDVDTSSKYFDVKWNRDIAFLTDGSKSYFFSATNKKLEIMASAYRDIDFIDDSVNIGLFADGVDNALYKFTVANETKEKLFDVPAEATKCYLSPDKLKIAVIGDNTIIYDLKNGKQLKRIDRKAAVFTWNDSQTFAASFENDSVYSISNGNINDEYSEISTSFYKEICAANDMIYYSFLNDDGTNSLIAYSINNKTKIEIERTDLETPIALAINDKSVLFIGGKNYEPQSVIMLIQND